MTDQAIDLRVALLLKGLRMPTIKRIYRKVAKEVSAAGGDYVSYLHTLLEEEVQDRMSRRIQRRIKDARFRQVKLLSELDEDSLPGGLTMDLLNEIARGEYLESASNIIAVGNSGTGKTHVCTGISVEACRQGRRVRSYTATELVSELESAQEEHQLHRYLKRFAKWELVFVDELGYLPISEHGADLLFQAFSERHERGSIIVNTNLPFSDWGQVFQTERLAVAMLDRITHRAQILEMNGESYRLKSARRGKKGSRAKK
ncbi:MAG: IS21-like element helper ATPase IstB [Dehalococcoidia bacterium]